jgi:hypothetical protein
MQALGRRHSNQNRYVQYGCGQSAPDGWRNFDASPTLRLQKLPIFGVFFQGRQFPHFAPNVEYGDIVTGLPLPKGCCRAIYSSHVLEHLSFEDCLIALRNTYSYIEDGGVFRLVIPDLEQLARDYLSATDERASVMFMEQSKLGTAVRRRGIKALTRELLGNSKHLWMWDFKSLSTELKRVGFRNIRRAEFGDSPEPRFAEVEELARWQNCLGLECIK